MKPTIGTIKQNGVMKVRINETLPKIREIIALVFMEVPPCFH